MFLNAGSSTFGETLAVLFVGPTAPATNLHLPYGKSFSLAVTLSAATLASLAAS